MKYVAIIILQYGNAKSTVECIASVERFNSYPVKYIIIDNASPLDQTSETEENLSARFGDTLLVVGDKHMVNNKLPKATYIKSAVNDGYARGNNKGLELAYQDDEIEHILILNNDILFVEDIIPSLVDSIEHIKDCALISPLLFKKDLQEIDHNCARKEIRFIDMLKFNLLVLRDTKRMRKKRRYDIRYMSGLYNVQLVSGSCILCRKKLFEQIGSFDPGTFIYYEEDILWEKIKRLQLCNYVDSNLRCIHIGASTIGKRLSPYLLKCSFDSQCYYVRRYMPQGKAKQILLRMTQIWVSTLIAISPLKLWRR